jgi:hypothetical protein
MQPNQGIHARSYTPRSHKSLIDIFQSHALNAGRHHSHMNKWRRCMAYAKCGAESKECFTPNPTWCAKTWHVQF